MSIASGFFRQTIDNIYSIARDKYGDKTATEEYNTVPCRWQEKIQQVIDKNGEEKKSRVEVWVSSDYSSISHDWKITRNSEDYYVISIENRVNLDGNVDHIKLFLV